MSYLGAAGFNTGPQKPPLYLDPGSGSFIFQLIIASLLGGVFIVKAYWKRITAFVRKVISRKEDEPEE